MPKNLNWWPIMPLSRSWLQIINLLKDRQWIKMVMFTSPINQIIELLNGVHQIIQFLFTWRNRAGPMDSTSIMKAVFWRGADEYFELWKIDNSKNHIVLVDEYQEKKLNGPNDLWVDPKGGIYFTDPYYQRPYWDRKEKEIEEERVYYLTPDRNELRIVADDLVQPNGIIGTPDGQMIYIADIGDKKTYSFSISENGDLQNKKLFTKLGSDGMTIDNQGNVYLTGNGVTVFNKKGEEILHIPVPQKWSSQCYIWRARSECSIYNCNELSIYHGYEGKWRAIIVDNMTYIIVKT